MTTTASGSSCTATLHDVIIDAGGTQVYAQGFESNLGSWTADGSDIWSRSTSPTFPVLSGAYSAKLTTPSGSLPGTISRVFTGLEVDRVYTAAFWVRVTDVTAGTHRWSIGVNGLGASAFVTPAAANTWEQRTYTFRATSTSHTLELKHDRSVAGDQIAGYVDDITLTEGVLYGSLEVTPSRLEIAHDERRAPFVEAVVTIPLPDELTVSSIDPRAGMRITLAATNTRVRPTGLPDQSRDWDLAVTGRKVYARRGELVIRAASDEAELLTTGNATASDIRTSYPNSPAAPYMLRTVVDNVLGLYGTSLEVGAADADVSPVTTVQNLIRNPNCRTAITGWGTNGASSTVTRQTGLVGGPVAGVTTYARAAFTGNPGVGAGGVQAPAGSAASALGIEPGKAYLAFAWVRSNVAKAVRLGGFYRDGSDSALVQVNSLDNVLVANTWTRVACYLDVAPENAARFSPYVLAGSATSWANGNTLDVLGWVVREVDTPFGAGETWGLYGDVSFDGDTAADAYYSYAWDDVANASSSTRTPLVDRNPDSLLWPPGELAWDYVAPLVQAAGLRLFCDEDRRWYLVDPATYTTAGSVAVDADNLVDGEDEISLEHAEWADGVVVPYKWTDAAGVRQERYDVAGAGATRLKTARTIERPYPGAGAAAAIYARAQGRGNEQTVVAHIELDANPGMSVTTDLPGVPGKAGTIAGVKFEWGTDDGTDQMTITPRDLVDA